MHHTKPRPPKAGKKNIKQLLQDVSVRNIQHNLLKNMEMLCRRVANKNTVNQGVSEKEDIILQEI